jgi:predicted Zn-dependent peptidase
VDDEFVPPGGGRLRVPDGIAHFLEHTLFETEEGNASDLFARRGAYSNAATSFTTTTYLFSAADRLYENLELLVRFVENPVFKPDRVEKEKGIIEQEIQGYRDDPHWVGYMGLLENLFVRHPVRIDIAGTPESIRQIDSATLHECYRTFYRPSNMILFAVGDIESDRFFEFVASSSRFASAPPESGASGPSGAVKRFYPEEPREVFRRETRKEMEVALPKLLVGFKEVGLPTGGEEYVLHDLASGLALEILFGRSSTTFQELYEGGLILDDFGAGYSIGAEVGHGIIGGETPQPDRLREILLGRISRLREGGIAPEDFERTRRMFAGSFIRGFNSLDYIASNYTYFRFHDFDLFSIPDLLARLDRDRLQERIRSLLDPENFASFVILPG